MRAVAATLALLLALPAAADSIRCDGGIVQSGDTTLDLIGKCGLPAVREADDVGRSRARLAGDRSAFSATEVTTTVERWTYDFGPSRFLQVVTLSGGRVSTVERGGYGHGAATQASATIRRASCDHLSFREGEPSSEVLLRCGPPATRDEQVVTEVAAVTTGDGAGPGVVVDAVRSTRLIETWTYDFGPSVLVRVLTLHDGVLRKVETAGHGYSR
jgi:hypothetical protein